MVDLKELQRAVYRNKVDHGFNLTDMHLELCYLYNEITEVFRAYEDLKDRRDGNTSELAEELADVAIYLLGFAEMNGIDLEPAILAKIEKNRRRKYVQREDGTYTKIENALESDGNL